MKYRGEEGERKRTAERRSNTDVVVCGHDHSRGGENSEGGFERHDMIEVDEVWMLT